MLRLTFAPEVSLRPARDGSPRWWLHAPGKAAFSIDSPAILSWLAQFAVPTSTAAAVLLLAPQDHQAAQALLQQLLKMDLLQDPDAVQIAAQALPPIPELLGALARRVYDLSADFQGLGAFADQTLRSNTGHGSQASIFQLLTQVDALRAQLAKMRAPHLAQQATKLGIGSDTAALLLHLGCGPVHLDGFVNIDVAPAPLSMNVLWGLPFEDHQARCVYLSHLLEHLFFPGDVFQLLKEIHRVLMPGGLLRVVVPDMAQCVAAYQAGDQAFFDARRAHFPNWPTDATMLENFLTYAGVGSEPGYLFESHKYGYDFATLTHALKHCGFSDIRLSQFNQSAEPLLRIEERSEAASWKAGERYLSLFVEAIKT